MYLKTHSKTDANLGKVPCSAKPKKVMVCKYDLTLNIFLFKYKCICIIFNTLKLNWNILNWRMDYCYPCGGGWLLSSCYKHCVVCWLLSCCLKSADGRVEIDLFTMQVFILCFVQNTNETPPNFLHQIYIYTSFNTLELVHIEG